MTAKSADAKKIDAALSLVAEGNSLRAACKAVSVPFGTMHDWLRGTPETWERYKQAQRTGTHALAGECIEISDEPPDRDPTGKVDPGSVAHRRLRIDTRLRLIGKWNQHDYGDKVTHAGDPDAPIVTEARLDVSKLSAEALREILAARDAAERG